MQPRIGLEFFEEAEDVGDGEFTLAAVDELDSLAALQVDAGDQHQRTSLGVPGARWTLNRQTGARCIVPRQGMDAISTGGEPRCCEPRERVSVRGWIARYRERWKRRERRRLRLGKRLGRNVPAVLRRQRR